jgi:hypothetical protein
MTEQVPAIVLTKKLRQPTLEHYLHRACYRKKWPKNLRR